MKMERLIGILPILLQRERVTTPELAEQVEVPPDHPAGHRIPVPGWHPHRHRSGCGRRHLHYGGLPGGPNGAHRSRDAGHPGRTPKPGQRQRHPALRPADGKAVRRDGRAGARRGPHAHRPLLLVQDQPAAQDRADPERHRAAPHHPLYLPLPQRGVDAHGGALPSGVPLVGLVCVGLVPEPGGFPPVQAQPHDGSHRWGGLSAPGCAPAGSGAGAGLSGEVSGHRAL